MKMKESGEDGMEVYGDVSAPSPPSRSILIEVTRLYHEDNVSLESTDGIGCTALMLASYGGHFSILYFLIENT